MFKISHHLIKRFDYFWHVLVNTLESISQEGIQGPKWPKTDILLNAAINLK